MITPANTDINNIIMTNKLKKALKKKNKYLPPLTLERQIIFENKPNSLISQFCSNISNDIINITNSTLKPSNLGSKRYFHLVLHCFSAIFENL